MTHPPFNQRPDYVAVHQLSLTKLRKQARSARSRGYYNLQTLWLFRTCYLRSGAFRDWLAYLSFRRDLGYLPNRHQHSKLLQFSVFSLWVKARGRRSLVHQAKRLRNHPSQQDGSRNTFISQVSQLAVVGNSPNISNTNCGESIDQHTNVLRFNQCFSDTTSPRDIGSKITIWCIAPGYRGPIVNSDSLKWLILAGPDMINWQQDTDYIKRIKQRYPNIKLLSIPLQTWARLVRQLAAPPSAGLLVLTYLKECKINVSVHGFGYQEHQQYHYALPQHQAVSRHNWLSEAEIIPRLYD